MRLVDVESSGQPHDTDASSTAATSSGTAASRAATLQATAPFALHPFAKFLDALLQVILIAVPKILGATLRSADADRFGGAFRAGSVHRQRGDIACADTLPAAS